MFRKVFQTYNWIIVIFIFVFFSLAVSSAYAGEDIEPVPIPIPPNKIDLNGIWNYSTSGHQVSGKCPAGTPMSGTLSMTQKGEAISLKMISGSKCKPAFVCSYTGVLKGNQAQLSNHGVVDEEGGEVTNAIGLVISSNESASGEVSSRYRHPKGMECHWTHRIMLTRKKEKK